jgi:DNA polymerase-1
MSEKKLFLLDGHALVYRAHFAFITRPLINSKGINTSAITGFVRTLWDLLKREKPTHIAVAFDPKGKTFRHDQFPEYKANRDAQPEDISIALPYIRKIVEAFNIPIIMVDNYEADDIIGTVAKQAEKDGFTVYMVTPDKDYAQLVSDKVFMYKPSRQGNGIDILGEKEVLAKWDIENVSQVIDILGLQGDSVDNIPGIPGIGAKTAVKLLKLYGTVEGLIENTDKLKGKQKEKVEEFAEQGLLSKQLATININSPITFDAVQYQIDPLNREELGKLFKELEFRTLANQILGDGGVSQGNLFDQPDSGNQKSSPSQVPTYSVASKDLTNTDHDYHLVDTIEGMQALAKTLKTHKVISFDTETTGIDANKAELVGLAWSVEKGKAFYVPIPEDRDEAMKRVAVFKDILEDPKVYLIGQNIKYDKLMMKWYDVELVGPYFDTMIAHYLCEPDLRHKLDYLSESYLNYKMVPIEALIGKRGKNQLTMRSVPIDKASEYAGEDADITLQMKEILEDLLKEQEIEDVYYKIEEPLIDVLTDMEYEGVNLDGGFLNKYSVTLGEWIAVKEASIYEKAGVNFNIGSPKQVGQVLFDKLEIPYRWKKTSSGAYSTDVEKLSELSVDHEIVKDILEYRKLAKLKSTYVDSLPLMINKKTDRIHSNFNQARAATGRLSSDNPNLQNIPIKNDEGREIRKAFVPRDKDHILLAADYSQIELRIVADVSKDPVMLDAFINGKDFHTATAAQVYDVDYDKVSAEQRRNAKTVNFSILYGAGATNLSRQLGIKRAEAKTLIDTYFTQFPALKSYMDETVQFARDNGYVVTLAGRKRTLRDINSRNGLTRSNAERIAVNTPIQGSAADMIKLAMIAIHKKLKEGNYKTKMILQVHDELVFDVYKPELDEIKTMVEELMRTAMPKLTVPIVVGMDTGANWLEAH